MSFNLMAQKDSVTLKDTAHRMTVLMARMPYHSRTLYVIDGRPIDDTVQDHGLRDIKTNDILTVDTLKSAQSPVLYCSIRDTIIIIETKESASHKYQKKFPHSLKAYLEIIETNKRLNNTYNYDDIDFVEYFVNGKKLKGSRDEIIKKLVKIKEDKIKSVYMPGLKPTDNTIVEKVFITTKK